MEWKLMEGDYVPDGQGRLTALSGAEEVLARVLYRLTARRGALPFLPELGSRLYQLGRERPSARQALAVQYVAEALREEKDLKVEDVELVQTGGITGANDISFGIRDGNLIREFFLHQIYKGPYKFGCQLHKKSPFLPGTSYFFASKNRISC